MIKCRRVVSRSVEELFCRRIVLFPLKIFLTKIFLTNFLTQYKDLHVQTAKGKRNQNCILLSFTLEQICSIYIHACAKWGKIGLVVLEIQSQCYPVLGLILFLIFINDLPDNIRSSVRLFADDCFLYRNIHSTQDCFILQEDLTSIGQWEADWQMKFNVAKCHSMRVTRHQHHKQILFDYSLHNQTLENVQSAKYLGITISDNMDWGQHISEISSKATKTLGFLRRNLVAFAPRSTKEVAYKTLVRPKLEYAAPIWSPYSKLQINQVEKVQRTAARWTCRRWRNTSSVGEMLDELEWPSLEARRDRSSLLLFHKIHSGAVSSALDKLLGQLGIYATWLSSIAYLQKQLRIFIFFYATFFFYDYTFSYSMKPSGMCLHIYTLQ